MISQKEMKRLKDVREKLKESEAKLRLSKAKLDDAEHEMIFRVKDGEIQEEGNLIAEVHLVRGKASISWKEEVLQLKGSAYVETLLQNAQREDVEKLEIRESLA